MIKFLFDAIQVEVIPDELLVDLAEELMVLQIAEPLDPAAIGFFTILRLLRHKFKLYSKEFIFKLSIGE